MSEPTACASTPWHPARGYCDNCDLLLGLEGLHVRTVEQDEAVLVATVESAPASMGCPTCGVVAHGHGRVTVELVKLPCLGRSVRVRWVKRRWCCPEPACGVGTFLEQVQTIARVRALSLPVVPISPSNPVLDSPYRR